MAEPTRPLIALFDGYADSAEMLAFAMDRAGFDTVDAHVSDVKRGAVDFVGFIAEHKPDVVIWDISPPYDLNWSFFQLLRSSSALKGCGVILTTTHKGHLDRLVGADSGAIEVVGKPYNIGLIVQSVRRHLANRVGGLPSDASRARES